MPVIASSNFLTFMREYQEAIIKGYTIDESVEPSAGMFQYEVTLHDIDPELIKNLINTLDSRVYDSRIKGLIEAIPKPARKSSSPNPEARIRNVQHRIKFDEQQS